MKTLKLIAFALLGFLWISCNSTYPGYEKNENGLYFRFYEKNENNRMAANNDIILVSMQIHAENDSLIMPTTEVPIMMQDSKYKGDIFEGLSMMHLEDSATFIINAKKYFEVYNYNQVPDFVTDKTMLWFTFKIKDIDTYEEFITKMKQQQSEIEEKGLEEYLLANNIDEEPKESGLIYIERKSGQGKSPKTGQKCVMHYTGKLLDGTIFDSSVERNQPFEFTLGVGQVIKGWDEGVALMKKGGKATLIIPSKIGYGENGAGNLIPPFSPLVFDVELLDIQ